MTKQDAILVQILAFTDAVWGPLRKVDWDKPTPTVLYEHRKRFRSKGLPWHSGDLSEAVRKAEQRILATLESAGLVTLYGEWRRTGVRLTEKGDIFVRALAGLGNVDAGHASLCEVLRLQNPIASELWLGGFDDYINTDDCLLELAVVQQLMLPALWRGWVESGSDYYGRVWYWATDQGHDVAQLPEPTLPADLPAMDKDAAGLYDNAVVDYREGLRHAKPDRPNELGFVPLSASIPLRPKGEVTRRTS